MRHALVTWQGEMVRTTGLAAASIAEYARDATAFVVWLERGGFTGTPAEVTAQDVRDYRDALLAAGRAPTTINRALVSLGLFLAAAGRIADNPVRTVDRIDVVERPPQALARTDWNAVRRAAAARATRDHGLVLALVCLMRFAGPRVGEVAALALPDVRLTARRGLQLLPVPLAALPQPPRHPVHPPRQSHPAHDHPGHGRRGGGTFPPRPCGAHRPDPADRAGRARRRRRGAHHPAARFVVDTGRLVATRHRRAHPRYLSRAGAAVTFLAFWPFSLLDL